tara:strand:+ start:202 stop:372 length:171 start_codon:yes stop_codon:yes gene_type:complete
MNYSIKVAISTFFAFVAMLGNYNYLAGYTNGGFALVVVFNLIAIAFGLATLFSKNK